MNTKIFTTTLIIISSIFISWIFGSIATAQTAKEIQIPIIIKIPANLSTNVKLFLQKSYENERRYKPDNLPINTWLKNEIEKDIKRQIISRIMDVKIQENKISTNTALEDDFIELQNITTN